MTFEEKIFLIKEAGLGEAIRNSLLAGTLAIGGLGGLHHMYGSASQAAVEDLVKRAPIEQTADSVMKRLGFKKKPFYEIERPAVVAPPAQTAQTSSKLGTIGWIFDANPPKDVEDDSVDRSQKANPESVKKNSPPAQNGGGYDRPIQPVSPAWGA